MFGVWRFFRTGKLLEVRSLFDLVFDSLLFAKACIAKYHFHRLHTETDCGRHRSWSCIQCNLLTADAYKEHMKIQHKFVFEEEVAFVLPKIEIESPEDENVSSMEFGANAINIDATDGDPLHLVMKEEDCIVADKEISSKLVKVAEENCETTSVESLPIK